MINIARLFIERAEQIMELVAAFLDGIRALANGDLSGAARMIEKALAKAIPIRLGFLAALIGISGLTVKVIPIPEIKKVRKRVDKCISKLIGKAPRLFGVSGEEGQGRQEGRGGVDGTATG